MKFVAVLTALLLLPYSAYFPIPPRSYAFEEEALAVRSGAFIRNVTSRRNRRTAVHLLKAIAARRRAHFRETFKEQRRLVQNGLFGPIHVVEIKHSKTKEIMEIARLKLSFARLSYPMLAQTTHLFLAGDKALADRGDLGRNHVEVLDWFRRHPIYFMWKQVLPVLTYAPWTLVARDEHNQIRAAIVSVIGYINSFHDIPKVWYQMLSFEKAPAKPAKRGKFKIWFDMWYTGGRDGALGFFILHATLAVAALLRCEYVIAYSNPRSMPNHPDLTPTQFASRAVLPFVVKDMLKSKGGDVFQSRENMIEGIRQRVPNHAMNDYADIVLGEILSLLNQYEAEVHDPDVPLNLRTFLANFSERYTIHDVAISNHLKFGARLGLIFENAFPELMDKPGVGAGYAFIMVYPIPAIEDWTVWISPLRNLKSRSARVARTPVGAAA